MAANDPEFAAARPDAGRQRRHRGAPGARLPQVVKAVLQGYADRPALAQHGSTELVKDPQTGRTSATLMPWFDKVTYGELAHRVNELSRAFRPTDWCQPATGSAVLGFTSVDYTTIDLALARSARCPCRCRPARPLAQLHRS